MLTNLPDKLVLDKLGEGLPGVSPYWGNFLSEASACCLEYHKHPQGVELKVFGDENTSFNVFWQLDITEQVLNAWNDEQELTEYGACGVAILLLLKLTDFTVIQRSCKGTGIDYWLGHKTSDKPFQNAARLEVSGILAGDLNTLKMRVRKKLEQTKPTDGTLPAYVVVVEFSEPISQLVEK
jgi:hypothetical protein